MPQLVLERGCDTVLPGTAVVVDQVVSRHSAKPGGKRPLSRIVALQRLKDLDEDLLSEIFSVAAASREPVADTINLAGVSSQQFLPGRILASQAALHKLQV